MMMFNNVSMLFLLLIVSACSSKITQNKGYEDFPDFGGEVIEVRKKITVQKGDTFDGKGNLFKWVGEGDCSQNEGMPAMFEIYTGGTLKNVWIENAPDGVHIKGSNVTIDNMVNVDVCEDAISISKSKTSPERNNIKIINSKFYFCEDKAIQITRGNNVLIKNNEFYSCAKAIRIKESAKNIRFENNKVFNAKSAIKVTGGKGFAKNNFFENAKIAFWAEQGGELIDGGGNVVVGVEVIYKETENGKVFRPSNSQEK